MNLILLPGMDGTGTLFGPLLEALPEWVQAKVVVYPPDVPLGYAELLPLVRAACPTMGEYVVLGESFSGPLAVMLAGENPPGLCGVILCVSFIRSPMSAPLKWAAAWARPVCIRLTPLRLARWALFGGHGADRLHRMLATALETVRPEVMAERARAIVNVDVSAELQRCRVPMLYLSSQRDRVVGPDSLHAIQRVKPDITVAELAGPHLLLQTRPVEAALEIGEFIQRLPRATIVNSS